MYRITFDVETDWGGRSDSIHGLSTIQHLILPKLKEHHIKSLFFITGSICKLYPNIFDVLKEHEMGWHGKDHEIYEDSEYASFNMGYTNEILVNDSECIRSPKFSCKNLCSTKSGLYNNPHNHLSVLRSMWFDIKPKKDTVIYAHPFDFYEWQGIMEPPSLFCRLWYSQPKRAWRHFENLLCQSTSFI